MGVHWETTAVIDQLPSQTPEAAVAAKLAEFGADVCPAEVPQQPTDELIQVGGTQWNRDFAALSEGLKAMDDRLAADRGLAGTINAYFPELYSIRDKTRQLAAFEAIRTLHDDQANFVVEVLMRPQYNGYRQEHEVALPTPGNLIPEAQKLRQSLAEYRASEDKIRHRVTKLLTDPQVGPQIDRFIKNNPDIGKSLTGDLSPRAQLKIIELIIKAPETQPAPAPQVAREIIDLAKARAAKAAKAAQTLGENIAQVDNRRKAGAVAAAAAVSVGLLVTPTHSGEEVASPTSTALPNVKIVAFQPLKPAVIVSDVIERDGTKPWGDQPGPAGHEVAILKHMEAHKDGSHSLLAHKNHPAVKQLITSVHAAADQYSKLAAQSSAHDALDKASVQFLAIALKGAIDNPHSIPHSLAEKALDTSNPFHVALTDANMKTLFPEGQDLPVPLNDEYKRMVAGVAALAQQAAVGDNQAAGEALAQQVATVRTQAALAEAQSSAPPVEVKASDASSAAAQPAKAAAPQLQADAVAPMPTLLVPEIPAAPAAPDATGEQTPAPDSTTAEPTPGPADGTALASPLPPEQATEPTTPPPATAPSSPAPSPSTASPAPAEAAPAPQSAESLSDQAIEALAARGNGEINWKNIATVLKFFMDRGYSLQQAAGLAGNFRVESGDDPTKDQIGGPAHGIAQWEAGRLERLKKFAEDKNLPVNDLQTQLLYVEYELDNIEQSAKQELLDTVNARDAAIAVERFYERPSKPHLELRIKYSEQIEVAYKQELKKLSAATQPEAVPAIPNADTTGFTTANGETYGPNPSVPYALHGVKHYSQHDHRWADKMYSIQHNPDQDISASGCEPSSMAMVISTLTDKIVSPVDMAEFALEHGFRTDNSGTVSQAIPAAAEAYNLQATQISDASQVMSAIQNNTDQHVDALIILDGHDTDPDTPPTKGGHYYVISQIDKDGKVWVNDPNSIDKTLHSWDLDQLVKASNSMWVISR